MRGTRENEVLFKNVRKKGFLERHRLDRMSLKQRLKNISWKRFFFQEIAGRDIMTLYWNKMSNVWLCLYSEHVDVPSLYTISLFSIYYSLLLLSSENVAQFSV
ncbi:uncharacterized protein PHALS_12400 [Plasmopara halstedii]|uniref:Uncharacterized protein n=1 Tax=Plasmopara halstedii TaxID=4781 RepID=A0A0P1AM56_PLAHL|nr:uncharacterized protein PHALS_12400 [Plasmopara halstedii]CEG42096.1 hypothetical protein PHALS_12400 [Plasmopara halstedii]|eukprot:XP_024578465.1 hypothetical protein PHALS_12400 [Plasmopara halstedii]